MILSLLFAAFARPVDASLPEARLTSTLAEAWHAAQRGVDLEPFQRAHPQFGEDAQVVVVLRPDVDGAAFARRLGLEIEAEAGALLQVRVPLLRLGDLASAPEVAHVREPWRPTSKGTTTEGYERTMLQDWHDSGPFTGEGVSVGVLDVGFDGYEALLGEELPDTVETDFDHGAPSSSAHGAAVAEVLHDFVPDAELHLVTFGTDVEFGQGLQTLLDAQVDVVNASVGFDNTWALDGTSPITQAADTLVDSGIIYVGAAGNEDQRYRVGELALAPDSQYVQIGDHYAILGDTSAGRAHVTFRWSEPFGAATVDLDLLVFDAETERECGRSENPQDGDDDPFEEVDVTGCEDTIYAAVYADSGTDVSGLTGSLYNYSGLDSAELTHTQTLSMPADCFTCVAVGAYLPDDSIAVYSSRGPTEDGRTKPDFVGPSDVTTTTFGEEKFTGSSAAAPHVAGLAALWVQATNLHDDPASFSAWQAEEARDLGAKGADDIYGNGAAAGDELPGCGCSGVGGSPAWAGVVIAAVSAAKLRRRR